SLRVDSTTMGASRQRGRAFRSYPFNVRPHDGSSFRGPPVAQLLGTATRTALDAAFHSSEDHVNPPSARTTPRRVLLQTIQHYFNRANIETSHSGRLPQML